MTGRLARLELLEGAEAQQKRRPQRRRDSGVMQRGSPAAGASLPALLVVGLEELGQATLDQLIRMGAPVVYMFDPAPGSAHAISRRTNTASRTRLLGLKPDSPDRAGIEKALRDVMGQVGAVVCCADRPSQLAECVAAVCDGAGVPLIVTELLNAGGCVGPVRAPGLGSGRGGCVECVAHYRAEGDRVAHEMRDYLMRRFPLPARWRPRAEPWVMEMISRLALLAAVQACDGSSGATAGRSMIWQLRDEPKEVEIQDVPAHYACRRCFPSQARTRDELRELARASWDAAWSRRPGHRRTCWNFGSVCRP